MTSFISIMQTHACARVLVFGCVYVVVHLSPLGHTCLVLPPYNHFGCSWYYSDHSHNHNHTTVTWL